VHMYTTITRKECFKATFTSGLKLLLIQEYKKCIRGEYFIVSDIFLVVY